MSSRPKPCRWTTGSPAGAIAVVLGRVEKQVGRIQHPDAAPAVGDRGDDVQAIEKDGVLVEDAGAVVSSWMVMRSLPRNMVRRRRRDFVVDDAPENVAAQNLQAGRVRILDVLHDPEPAALVEAHRDRLLDDRLREHLIEAQIVRDSEGLGRFGGRQLRLLRRASPMPVRGVQRSISIVSWNMAFRANQAAGSSMAGVVKPMAREPDMYYRQGSAKQL